MIKNAKDTLLNQGGSTLPNVSSAMDGWFQPMTFNIITKKTENYKLVETVILKSFRGVWQSLRGQALYIKPEGQRNWKWYQVHSDVDLDLKTDDVIDYIGTKYRVMDKTDQSGYGYYEYHVVEDYEDA